MFPSDAPPAEVFANAFFSSAAGFTTGGISLFDEPEKLSQSFTFFRSYTQLVGGMSFIYLVITAFYPESKLQAMRGFISGKTLHMKELFLTITVIFVAIRIWRKRHHRQFFSGDEYAFDGRVYANIDNS